MANLDLSRLRRFGVIHYRAKRDELSEDALLAYQNERDRLEQELRDAQYKTLPPGHRLRRNLRVPCSLLVHFNMGGRVARAATLDVSATGLAAGFARPVQFSDKMNVRLMMPDGEPLFIRGRKVYIQPRRNGGVRLGCEFVDLGNGEVERLERLVFDDILERLAS